MLHVLTAAEELPIGILHPTCDNGFIAFVKRVLEVHQADHQTRVDAEPSEFFGEAVVDRHVELLLIDLTGKHVEWVLRV